MAQKISFKQRQRLAFYAVVAFSITLFALDFSITFSESNWDFKDMHLKNSISGNTTILMSQKDMQIVKMGKRTWNTFIDHVRDIKVAFNEKRSLKTINSFQSSQSKNPKSATNIQTHFAVTTTVNAHTFAFFPGLISMDKDLTLPTEVPFRPNSTEPILQYSQQRDYETIISHDSKCGIGEVVDLNLTNFNYESDIFLLLIVKSSCNLKIRRDAIRSTWGNETWVKEKLNINMRRLFLLGKCESKHLQDDMFEEDKENGDLLQWDFFDSFRNLTLKDCLFLQWVARSCRNVPYIFKGDDDTFVNLPNIVKALKEVPLHKREDLFRGSLLRGSMRILDPTWKYYVSYNLYPEKVYPPYVSGGGFIMSSHIAVRLFTASLSTRIIPIDDAFLGILLKKIGVEPENDHGFKNWGFKNFQICRLAKIKTYHKMYPENLRTVWAEYLALDVSKCTNETDDVFLSHFK